MTKPHWKSFVLWVPSRFLSSMHLTIQNHSRNTSFLSSIHSIEKDIKHTDMTRSVNIVLDRLIDSRKNLVERN